jgi:1-acyl-sn-glycerol-3-phosphate acyltransferase
VLRALGRSLLRVWGWRIVGEFPALRRFVIVVAPHTSNWDFVVGLAAKFALSLRAVWIGKHTLFRPPFGKLLRRLGGVPVHRDAPHAVVQQIIDEFAAREAMVFVLAPEGTRKRVERWRSGYWHVAHGAGVPVIPVGFDFALRTIFIGPPHETTDDLNADEERLRAYVRGIAPRHPGLFVP